MGILDKIIGRANTAYDKVTDVEYAMIRDRRYDAADRLAGNGDGSLGVITGIRGR